MDDSEPTLPPHPQTTLINARPARPSILTRKRTHDQSLYDGELLTATSSDPALFSGDEYESIGAEDYTTKRKKKMYTGSWWSHRMKADRHDRKKEFKRNFDSGIFMGSESDPPSSDSINSLEDELLRDQATATVSRDIDDSLSILGRHVEDGDIHISPSDNAQQAKRENLEATSFKRITVGPPRKWVMVTETSSSESEQRDAVIRVVRKCLEDGQETVDLSAHRLSGLPPEIRELAYLTKQTNFVTGMLDSGTSLETHLRLFLGQNMIREFPTQLLDLTNLRELSLFRNKLTKLPTGIRSLVNLEKLNISGNKLASLPFELVELVADHRLREVAASNNLWGPPTPKNMSHCLKPRSDYLARDMQPIPTSTNPETSTSLTEMVLRQLARLRPLERLDQYMPLGTSPRVLTHLQTHNEALQEGGRRCNSCQRLIVQSIEWIEWWWVVPGFVPIKRVLCEGKCEGSVTDWCDKPPPAAAALP